MKTKKVLLLLSQEVDAKASAEEAVTEHQEVLGAFPVCGAAAHARLGHSHSLQQLTRAESAGEGLNHAVVASTGAPSDQCGVHIAILGP